MRSITSCYQSNYNDSDGGILYGRWTETYPKNSTPPTAWTGSVAIIEKFMKKKHCVRYGQCWVFSGLVTSCKYARNTYVGVRLYVLVTSCTGTRSACVGAKLYGLYGSKAYYCVRIVTRQLT